jgi:hypothetical protein
VAVVQLLRLGRGDFDVDREAALFFPLVLDGLGLQWFPIEVRIAELQRFHLHTAILVIEQLEELRFERRRMPGEQLANLRQV